MTHPRPDRLEALLVGFDVATSRPPAFPTADVTYAVHDTSVGRMLLACNESGALVASLFVADAAAEDAALVRLAARISPRVLRRPDVLEAARRWLDDYLAGRTRRQAPAWELALATPFQKLVLSALVARLGYGERATYGQLAHWSGCPGAARAVGTALGSNPLCIVLPCHRVVGATGALTGYAGGLAAKRHLLDLEAGADRAAENGPEPDGGGDTRLSSGR